MEAPQILLETSRFQVLRKTVRLPSGVQSTREIVHHPGAVVILPILDDGRICLIENFRISLERRLIELPAGTLDPGEDPLSAAHRELTEETGHRAASMERLLMMYPSPGILDEKMHLFVATGLTPGAMDLDEGEDIRLHPATWDEALAMVRDNRIEDAKTVAGLLFFHVFQRGRSAT